MNKNRYNTGTNVLCSMILLTANVALEIFPSPDEQIFVHPLHCLCKDNRPPVKDPLGSTFIQGGNKLREATIPLIFLKRKMETDSNGNQIVGWTEYKK